MRHLLLTLIVYFAFIVNTSSQHWIWAKSAAGGTQDKCYSFEMDAGGNLLIAGEFDAPSFGWGNVTLNNNTNDHKLFLVKTDINGNVLWAHQSAGNSRDHISCVSSDASGNIFVTGGFDHGSMTIGSITLNNSASWGNDIFLAKYSSSGQVIWAKRVLGTENDGGEAIQADINGNVFVAGNFSSPTLDFGSTQLNIHCSDAYCLDVFLAKYDGTGNVIWVKGIGGSGEKYITSVATDSLGNLFVAGSYLGSSLVFDSITIPNGGGWDLFAAKYDPAGNVLWAKRIGGPNLELSSEIASDENGNIFVSGYTTSPDLMIDTNTIVNSPNRSSFVVKLNTAGDYKWARLASGNTYNQPSSLDASQEGIVSMTGFFEGSSITFDSVTISPVQVNCSMTSAPFCHPMYFIQYDSAGNVICSTGLSTRTLISKVIAASAADVFIAGSFTGSPLVIGNDSLSGNPGGVFFAKYSCDNITDVNEVSLYQSDFLVFPNPSDGLLSLRVSKYRKAHISVYNLIGNQIFSGNFSDQEELRIDLKGKPKGVYFIELATENEKQVKKIILY